MNFEIIKKTIVDVPDFPIKGVSFKDITPLFLDPQKFEFIIEQMALSVQKYDFDTIIAPELRGFLFAIPLALKLKKRFVLVRKAGKLPTITKKVKVITEYSTVYFEVNPKHIIPNSKVLIVDDVVATGGTFLGLDGLINGLDANVAAYLCLIELTFLTKKQKFPKPLISLIQY